MTAPVDPGRVDPGHEPETTRLLSDQATTFWVRALYGVCLALVLVGVGFQLFTHAFDHAHYGFERWPGFYGLFGFAAFVFLVTCGKGLRRIVSRSEDYYRMDEPERSK